eukprot:scpid84492/ scgid34415/ Partner of Y14 and mago; Protein wibg homolog
MAERRVVGDDGQMYIPASRRPDGTYRKERRVKEGYIPQEEVAAYESKGAKYTREVAELPPAGMAPAASASATAGMSKAQRKNEKRKQKRKAEKDCDETVESVTKSLAAASVSVAPPATDAASAGARSASVKSDVDKPALEKRLKALRKRLRQIDDLLKKRDGGVKLEKEQLEKVECREDVLDEIFAVEEKLK